MLVAAAVAIFGIWGVVWGFFGQAERDDAGSIAAAGDLDAVDLRVGDCFDDDAGAAEEDVFELNAVVATPCAEPHDNEVFYLFQLEAETLPSDEAIGDEAFGTCVEVFEEFLGTAYADSELDFSWLWPTTEGWRDGDRTVTCYLYAMDWTKLEGSMAGTGR